VSNSTVPRCLQSMLSGGRPVVTGTLYPDSYIARHKADILAAVPVRAAMPTRPTRWYCGRRQNIDHVPRGSSRGRCRTGARRDLRDGRYDVEIGQWRPAVLPAMRHDLQKTLLPEGHAARHVRRRDIPHSHRDQVIKLPPAPRLCFGAH
jgi:hypothetical protein